MHEGIYVESMLQFLLISDVVRMLSGDNTIDMKEVLSACPLCAQNNRKGSLKRFHISIDESTVLCDNDLVSLSLTITYIPHDNNY